MTTHRVGEGETVRVAEGIRDARWGVGLLLTGFVLQGLAYMLALAGVAPGGSGDSQLLGALLTVAVVVSATLIIKRQRRRVELATLLYAAAMEGSEQPQSEWKPIHWARRAEQAVGFGTLAGWPARDSESRTDYVRREKVEGQTRHAQISQRKHSGRLDPSAAD